jgi:hypothetical protein
MRSNRKGLRQFEVLETRLLLSASDSLRAAEALAAVIRAVPAIHGPIAQPVDPPSSRDAFSHGSSVGQHGGAADPPGTTGTSASSPKAKTTAATQSTAGFSVTIEELPAQPAAEISGALTPGEMLDLYRVSIQPDTKSVVVRLTVPRLTSAKSGVLDQSLVMLAPSSDGLPVQALAMTPGTNSVTSRTFVASASGPIQFYIGVARSSDAREAIQVGPWLASPDESAESPGPLSDDSTSADTQSTDDSSGVDGIVGQDIESTAESPSSGTVVTYLLEVFQTGDSLFVPTSADSGFGVSPNLSVYALIPDRATTFLPSAFRAISAGSVGASGAWFDTDSGRMLVSSRVTEYAGSSRALPLRASGPLGGALADGPQTRPVDLRDALALELAKRLLEEVTTPADGDGASEEVDLVSPPVEKAGGWVQVVASFDVESVARGNLQLGPVWPIEPSVGDLIAPPTSLLDGQFATNSTSTVPGDVALATSSQSTTTAGNDANQTHVQSKRKNAMRLGLGLAYALAFSCLLPDLTAYFQARRYRTKLAQRSRLFSWCKWPRRWSPRGK